MEPGAAVNDLPEFGEPPVVEMALSVQFRMLPVLRGLALAPLYEQWKGRYPRVEEHPPIPLMAEGDVPGGPVFQLNLGAPSVRYWFLAQDGIELVQLQQDMLSVNWREQVSGEPYPRYAEMRRLFFDRFNDLENFLAAQQSGQMQVTQLELSYTNAVNVEPRDRGKLGRILTTWNDDGSGHHLGEPEQVQLNMSYQVEGIGVGVSRLWVQAAPGQRSTGAPATLLTFTIRGVPAGEGKEQIRAFLDKAHDEVVRSFAELTTRQMHEIWGRRR